MTEAGLIVGGLGVLMLWAGAVAFAADWLLRCRHGLPGASVRRAAERGAVWTVLLWASTVCTGAAVGAVLPALPAGAAAGWAVPLMSLALTHLAATGIVFDSLRRPLAETGQRPGVPTWEVLAASAVAGAVWPGGVTGLVFVLIAVVTRA